MFPPGCAPLTDATEAHRSHRAAWYASLVGPLLVPADEAAGLRRYLDGETGSPERLDVGLVGPLAMVPNAISAIGDKAVISQIEAPVAKRGEDPMPGLRDFLKITTSLSGFAEVPLTWGLLAALDALTDARAAGQQVAPKFRTGGLAAELFPTPVELAAVICACRDRELPFKLTAGLHHALRHTDPETGFLHHGFLNVLAASIAAADGAEAADVAEVLASTDAIPLVESAQSRLDRDRPLWVGFGTCGVREPLADMRRLGLLRIENTL